MKVIDQHGQILPEYDLTKGELVPGFKVKDDATPIDNISKFSWAPEDFEECLIYLPLKDDHKVSDNPTDAERIAELEEALDMILRGVTE